MLFVLIIKEIKNNIISLRFAISATALLLLIIGLTITLNNSMAQDEEQYYRDKSEQTKILDLYAHYNRINPLVAPIRPTNRMAMFFTDSDVSARRNSFFENPIYYLHREFDLMDLMVYILSVMALVFAFDAICGERENGTLKLLSAFGVPRARILSAKLMAGLMTIIIPLVIIFAISFLYLFLQSTFSWHAYHWLAFLTIFIASVLHFCCYYAVGMFASSITSSSGRAITIAFLMWTGMVFLIPNISPFIATWLAPVPAVEKVRRNIERIRSEERDELGRKFAREIEDRYRREHPAFMIALETSSQEELEDRLFKDQEFRELYDSLKNLKDSGWAEANRIQAEKVQTILDDLRRRSDLQIQTAKIPAYLSPSANLSFVIEGMSATGNYGYNHFGWAAWNYRQQFRSYIDEKYKEKQEEDPLFTSEMYLNVSDRPKFIYREAGYGERIETVWLPLMFLSIWGLIFIVLTYWAFQRYDIR